MMCGIVGIFGFAGGLTGQQNTLELMADSLHHRGPDEKGSYFSENIALGFRRLSIIDIENGQQPVVSNDRSVVSICNGELYNHHELRRELQQRGHQFTNRSDTELIPALYQSFGDNFARKINGQFAFAVYDLKKNRLILGRDHVGIAPLFYANIKQGVVFASEIKGLLEHPEVPRQVNLRGLDQIFTFPGMVSPCTLFQGVESLSAGTILVIEGDGQSKNQTYWDLDYPLVEELDESRSIMDCVDELDAALRQSIKYRLQADVPTGSYLSGGLDSSLISAIAADLTGNVPRHSFSIAFDDPKIDERSHQTVMVKLLNSIHHEAVVGPAQVEKHLLDMVKFSETPLRESYNACSLMLSEMAHQNGIKVILTGEGADELFGGYVGYRLDAHRTEGLRAVNKLDSIIEDQMRRHLWGDSDFFYEKDYHAFSENKRSIYSIELNKKFKEFDCLARSPVKLNQLDGRHHFHKRSYLDFKLRMADHLLADHGDRMAYANGVEARYPFLDTSVIDVARKIHPQIMVKDGQEKFILKTLARKYLPDSIINRNKFSFVAPSSSVLLLKNKQGILKLLSAERIKKDGYFNPETVDHLIKKYSDKNQELNQTFEDDWLMIVLTFNIFLDTFKINKLEKKPLQTIKYEAKEEGW
jgi:asparagine synthase (glutamine-hydrolysing)